MEMAYPTTPSDSGTSFTFVAGIIVTTANIESKRGAVIYVINVVCSQRVNKSTHSSEQVEIVSTTVGTFAVVATITKRFANTI
jgi:hypothetical protein